MVVVAKKGKLGVESPGRDSLEARSTRHLPRSSFAYPRGNIYSRDYLFQQLSN